MTDINGILLKGLDGSNPLAFLAALGTLRTLTLALPDETVKMSWEQHDGAWRPRIFSSKTYSEKSLVETVLNKIKDSAATSDQSTDEADLKKVVAQKKKAVKDAREALKERRLKGNDLKAARQKEIEPLEAEFNEANKQWLESLAGIVPSLELSLGRDLSASPEHFRTVALRSLEEAFRGIRHPADLLAHFGSEVCADLKTKRLDSTPFCFITGSGHQYFLDTAKELIARVDTRRIQSALFENTPFSDEKLSMRWAPIEDRRYALMWADPTSVGNEPLTSWALNLLAYRGLSLIPAVPTKHGFRTAGFFQDKTAKRWAWPLWQFAATSDVARSLLSDARLIDDAMYRSRRGVAACFSSQRLVVGNPPLHKINFSPSMPC